MEERTPIELPGEAIPLKPIVLDFDADLGADVTRYQAHDGERARALVDDRAVRHAQTLRGPESDSWDIHAQRHASIRMLAVRASRKESETGWLPGCWSGPVKGWLTPVQPPVL